MLEHAAKPLKEGIIHLLFTHLINVGLHDSQKGLVLPLLEGIWKFWKVFLVVMVTAGGGGPALPEGVEGRGGGGGGGAGCGGGGGGGGGGGEARGG